MRASRSELSTPAAAKERASRRRASTRVVPGPICGSSVTSAALPIPLASRAGLFGGHERRLVLRDQGSDDLVERFALYHLRQLVEGEIDAVVSHPRLRKIVGTDAFRPVSGTDLAAAIGRTC